jgi:hypothetical protein
MSSDDLDKTRNRRCATSDLAHELGAIASAEDCDREVARRTDRFATGLLRLIREEIAAAAGGTIASAVDRHLATLAPSKEPLAVGDTTDHGPGTVVYEVIETRRDGSIKLDGCGAWSGEWVLSSELLKPWNGWRVVRAIAVPKAPAKEPGHPEPYRVPAPNVIAVDDTFLRVDGHSDERFRGGEIGLITAKSTDPAAQLPFTIGGYAWAYGVNEYDLLQSGRWQRVPAGYVLPGAIDYHRAVTRLIEAYRASLADPETGLRGAHECMQEMARMAGMEVPT